MDSNEIFENNLRFFQVKKRYPNRAVCICPAHSDKQESLTITRGNKCTLFHCFAGCSTDSILSAVGLKIADTFYEKAEKVTDWRKYVEGVTKKKLVDSYDYKDFKGHYAFTKLRMEPKSFIYGKLENNRFKMGLNGQKRKEIPAFYGEYSSIVTAISQGSYVFLCEGEKDVRNLYKNGIKAALCFGGADDWSSCYADILKDSNLVILLDNDEPGRDLGEKVKTDCISICRSIKSFTPYDKKKGGDVSDFFENGGTAAELMEKVKNVTEKTVLVAPFKVKTFSEDLSEIVQRLNDLQVYGNENYPPNDKGFSKVYALVFKRKIRYNPDIREFMAYDGTRWLKDVEGMRARQQAKRFASAFLVYVGTAGIIDKEFTKAVISLNSKQKRNTILEDAKDETFFCNADLDNNDYILNLQNGTLDITKEPILKAHNPEDLLSKVANADYIEKADCPIWLKFLDEIMLGDAEKIKYLQKICGLSLTGNTTEEQMFILYGSSTRNGKSTLIETILFLLGDYGLTIKPESLAMKNNADSRTASGDIARLNGARLVNCPEPPKRMMLDCGLLKTLTGRDSITARNLYEREFSFTPKFKLIMNTNFLPLVTDSTVFSSGRINVVTFDRHFSEDEQDKTLKDRLKTELSGILNWCLEGLKLYRSEGLKPPETVRNATEEYKSSSDKIGLYFSECMSKAPGNNLKVGEVYDSYSKWCDDNGYGTENKQNFISDLKIRGMIRNSGTVKGITVYNVVTGYDFKKDAEFIEIPDGQNLPF